MSRQRPGDTSVRQIAPTRLSESSGSSRSSRASAAATTAGDRLIPAPQQTSVRILKLIIIWTDRIAARSRSGAFPSPSRRGNRQTIRSRDGPLLDGELDDGLDPDRVEVVEGEAVAGMADPEEVGLDPGHGSSPTPSGMSVIGRTPGLLR